MGILLKPTTGPGPASSINAGQLTLTNTTGGALALGSLVQQDYKNAGTTGSFDPNDTNYVGGNAAVPIVSGLFSGITPGDGNGPILVINATAPRSSTSTTVADGAKFLADASGEPLTMLCVAAGVTAGDSLGIGAGGLVQTAPPESPFYGYALETTGASSVLFKAVWFGIIIGFEVA